MGFEPTRAEHIGLAVQRLNHSATSSHPRFEVKFMEWWISKVSMHQKGISHAGN